MKKLFIWPIRLYQLCLGPFIGDCCRFYPTCSNYALDALNQKKLPEAMYLIIKRVLKCHPFCKGGVDFVPSGDD